MISQFAWAALTDPQKESLEKERRAGRVEFGGMGWKAPYLFVQEGSFGGSISAGKAGIQPTYFIRKALDAARSNLSGNFRTVLSS